MWQLASESFVWLLRNSKLFCSVGSTWDIAIRLQHLATCLPWMGVMSLPFDRRLWWPCRTSKYVNSFIALLSQFLLALTRICDCFILFCDIAEQEALPASSASCFTPCFGCLLPWSRSRYITRFHHQIRKCIDFCSAMSLGYAGREPFDP